MKKTIYYLAILFILFGCNSGKSDWEKAQNLNTLVGYKDFLSKHSEGELTQKALAAVDSLEWKEALTTLDTSKLRDYIETHSTGAYLENAKLTLDSIEWKEVLSSRDSSKIKNRIKRYPTSKYIEQANEILWEIKWPPVKVERANSILIWKDGSADIIIGSASDGLVANTNGIPFSDMQIEGQGIVFIWRNFGQNEIREVTKLELRIGAAYLKTKSGFRFIRKVDLSKSDKQLRAEFGLKDF